MQYKIEAEMIRRFRDEAVEVASVSEQSNGNFCVELRINAGDEQLRTWVLLRSYELKKNLQQACISASHRVARVVGNWFIGCDMPERC